MSKTLEEQVKELNSKVDHIIRILVGGGMCDDRLTQSHFEKSVVQELKDLKYRIK